MRERRWRWSGSRWCGIDRLRRCQAAQGEGNDWFEYLLGRYQAVKEELEFFEYAVGQLSGRLPEVVRDMVMEDMTWREMAEKYNVSETMIAKYRKKALAEMKELYRIREKTTGRYLLD